MASPQRGINPYIHTRARERGRGLHSSTLQLNLSAFCETGGAVWECFGVVEGVVGDMRGI